MFISLKNIKSLQSFVFSCLKKNYNLKLINERFVTYDLIAVKFQGRQLQNLILYLINKDFFIFNAMFHNGAPWNLTAIKKPSRYSDKSEDAI